MHAFHEQQEDIDRLQMIVAQSEVSHEAVHQFDASMERLRKLEQAAGYVELLSEVDAMRCVDNGRQEEFWRSTAAD